MSKFLIGDRVRFVGDHLPHYMTKPYSDYTYIISSNFDDDYNGYELYDMYGFAGYGFENELELVE